jgi:DNA modification methylase
MSILLARADARALPLRDRSVQCCITSPPYWGLRDYGTPGQLGLEHTPEEYVEHMVEVFREVRRVLRNDGVLWLNLGDSYAREQASNVPQTKNRPVSYPEHCKMGSSDGVTGRGDRPGTRSRINGLKPKDLVGIPWMVAFALRADGWWLRSDIVWNKPNSMPESVTDRPTRAHEYVFLFSKAERYYYDSDAVKEQSTGQTGAAANFKRTTKDHILPGQGFAQHREDRPSTEDNGKRNLRSVWSIPTQPYKGAHYATFPEKLVEPCILAGTSARGACDACGAPWGRVVEHRTVPDRPGRVQERDGDSLDEAHGRDGRSGSRCTSANITAGWQPTCGCDGVGVHPCLVLDPFCGTATVARVSIQHKRLAFCCDISGEYLAEQADRRTRNVQVNLL